MDEEAIARAKAMAEQWKRDHPPPSYLFGTTSHMMKRTQTIAVTDEDEENQDEEGKKKKKKPTGPTARLDKIVENLQELKAIYRNRKEERNRRYAGQTDSTFKRECCKYSTIGGQSTMASTKESKLSHSMSNLHVKSSSMNRDLMKSMQSEVAGGEEKENEEE